MATDHFGVAGGDYVPDPDRETTELVEAFFAHVAGTLQRYALPARLLDAMRGRHEELIAADRHLVVDEPARHNLRLTLALLAAYRHLEPEIGRQAALDAVQAAFLEPYGEVLQEGTRAMLDAAPDPFAAMVALSRTRERDSFGAGFTFDHAADDDRRYLVDVRRCFYHDVLAGHGAPELTTVMCEFDRNWIRAIDPERHGLTFERTTTIGRGGTHCPFHFRRTE